MTMKHIAALIITPGSYIHAADPFIDKQDLLIVGDNPGYSLYHIPGVVVTAKGTVLT